MAASSMFVAQASSAGSSGLALNAAQVPPREDATPFPPFDPQYWAPQIIWLIVLFGVLYLAMSKLALPRVGSIIAERRSKVAGDLGQAEAARKQAEDERAAYEKLVAEARTRAQSEGQAKHAELAAQSEATRRRLDAEVAGKLAAADRQIEDTKTRAMSNVSSIARDAAAAIAERLLGRAVDGATVDRALTETLDR